MSSEYSQTSDIEDSIFSNQGEQASVSTSNATSSYASKSTNTNSSSDMNPEKSFMSSMQKMPIMLTIALIFYFLLGPILMLKPTTLESGSGFLANQMFINSSLLVTFSIVYGMLCQFFPDGIITKYQNLLLPIVLIVCMWLKGLFTYRNNLITYCKVKYDGGEYSDSNLPYRSDMLIWNTSKVPIAIFATYVFIILFPQSVIPFNQFFCGEETPHPLVVFFSIGFWTGCATWAAEASCYFSVLRDGCQPANKVDFASINDKIKAYEDD